MRGALLGEGQLSRRRLLRAAGAAGAAGLWAYLRTTAFAAPAAQVIRVGTIPVLDCSQLWLGLYYGFYERAGLRVEFQNMAGGAVIAPAVEGGTLDVGWSNTISIIIAHEKGFDYQFIMPGAYENAATGNIVHKFLTAPDSGITDMRQLAGKRVAVNTLGNISELGARARLKYWGVDPDSVRYVEVDYPSMIPAIMNKRVDAGLVLEPFVTVGLQQGARLLDPHGLGSIGDRFMIASWFAKRSWLEKNREVARRFVEATLAAQSYYQENPSRVYPAIAQYTRVPADLAPRVTMPAFMNELLASDIQVMIDKAYEFGFIRRRFDAREIIWQGA